MRQWTAMHVEAHCGGSSGATPGGTGDPMLDVLMPIIGQAANRLGEAFAREIFGFSDPAEERRLAELRRLEQARQAELARQRQEALERRRRQLHARLMSDLVRLGSGGELSLMDMDGRPAAPHAAAAARSPLPLLDLDDGLRPAGTAFFGLGGGGPAPLPAHIVDLRDLRRAAYLVEQAGSAGSSDRPLLIDEAVRAIEGDGSLLADAPPGFAVAQGEDKLAALRARQHEFEQAAQNLRVADGRRAQADWVVRAAEQAEHRARQTLARMQAERAPAERIAEQRALLENLIAAAQHARESLATAQRELDLARELQRWAEWGRRQQVATLDGSAWAELNDGERRSRAQLESIYRRKLDVPPPELPGAVARAENGRRALAALEQLEASLSVLPEAERAAARERLEAARHRAELMDYTDRVINAHTRSRIEQMRQLEGVRDAAEREVRAFAAEAVDTFGSALGAFRKAGDALLRDPALREAAQLLALHDRLDDAGKLHAEFGSVRRAMQSGSLPFDEKTRLSERASGLAAALASDLALLERSHPELARRFAARAGPWIAAGHGVARSTHLALELVDLHQQARLLDGQLGDQARHLRRVQEQYARHVQSFHHERRALEELLARRASVTPVAAAAPR
jgi:hypothetical protein